MNRHVVLCAVFVAGFVFFADPVPADPTRQDNHSQNPHATSSATAAQSTVPETWYEAQLVRHTRQLTFAGRRAGEGYFSPDGSQLIFQSEREPGNPFFQIYVMNRLTGQTRRVSPGIGKTTCAWFHPSQEKVLFASTHEDPDAEKKQRAELEERRAGTQRRYEWDFDEQYDLFEITLDGRDMRKLTAAKGYDAEASWSPNGEFIVFASNRHAYAVTLSAEEKERFQLDPSSQLDIYIMRADGSDMRRLTTTPGYDGGPFFSPDGNRLVWRRFSPDGARAEVWTMRIDGTDQRQVTKLGAMSWAPYFHPSGDYLIFTTNRHGFGNFELYIVDTKGRAEPVRVTHTNGFDGLPVFAPDGKHLSWTSSRTADKKAQLFFADWDDAAARCLLGLDSTDAAALRTHEARTCELRQNVAELASERMAGRLTGTDGEKLATEYAAAILEKGGLEPAGDNGTFFSVF